MKLFVTVIRYRYGLLGDTTPTWRTVSRANDWLHLPTCWWSLYNGKRSISIAQYIWVWLLIIIDLFFECNCVQGKIACANVLSDLYALGVTECDNMLMLLGVSQKFSEKERDVVVPMMINGFKDCAEEGGVMVTGGQTVINPWMTIGGAATTVCQPNEFIMYVLAHLFTFLQFQRQCQSDHWLLLFRPDGAVVGDVLVLTKPLGTQVAVNAYQWIDVPEKWNRIKLVVGEDDVRKAYLRAMYSMARLNLVGMFHTHSIILWY